MEIIRNSKQKVVCCADAKEKCVEILLKGICTQIRFKADDTIEVEDIQPEIS